MKTPTLEKQIFVDIKSGYLSSPVQQIMDILFQQMQLYLTNGLTADGLTTDEITNAADPNNRNAKSDGTIWYDTDAQVFKGKINGVVKTFTLV